MNAELTYKRKRITIVATWLVQAEKELGKRSTHDIYWLVYSLIVSSLEENIHFNEYKWPFDDSWQIAKEANLKPLDLYAAAILRGLRTKVTSAQSEGLRICSNCRREKPLNEFTSYQRYCRKCRHSYNVYWR